MKEVPFNIACALKKAGYPQSMTRGIFYNKEGEPLLVTNVNDRLEYDTYAPSYFDVWLWLWRTHKFRIMLSASNQRWDEVHGIVTGVSGEVCKTFYRGIPAYDATDHFANYKDPEEAIVGAVNYLFNNDLIN